MERILAFDNGSNAVNHESIKKEFPWIKHNRIEINSGYSGGFNRAIKWAIKEGFDNFLFLTNDTLIEKDALKNILEHSEKTGSEFAAPKIVYENQKSSIDSIGGFFDFKNFTLGHYKEENIELELNMDTDYVPGSAFWFTKNIFEKLNGMDESLHTYWEDVDFSFRAHRAGVRITRCYDSVIFHGVGKTCHKKPLYSTYYFQRNRIRFCKKYLSIDQWGLAKEKIKKDLDRIKEKSLNDKIKTGYIEELFLELM